MRKRSWFPAVTLALLLSILSSGCGRTEISAPGTDTNPSKTQPPSNSATFPTADPTQPHTEPPTEPPTSPHTQPSTQPPTEPPTEPQTQPPTSPDSGDELIGALYTRYELSQLNNTNQGYGAGSAANGKRPEYALSLEKQFGEKYDAHFIAPDNGKIYLTFSLGYEFNNLTADILDTLQEKGVKAVFFINMHYAEANYDLVRRMIDEGHIVANHTRYHYTLADLSIDGVVQEILSLHDYVLETYGYEMTMFRPPSGYYSERVLAIAHSLGYTTVNWSFAYRDWDEDDQPNIDEARLQLIEWAHSGAIYALHTVSETNAAILADVIDGIRDKGLEFALYTGN